MSRRKKLEVANLQLDDKQRTLIMQWFMYGGGVAGGGLLLGLLLPHLLPRRKKKRPLDGVTLDTSSSTTRMPLSSELCSRGCSSTITKIIVSYNRSYS
ncbi:hypothetical protein OS31_25750 [Dickeya oryzae]